MKQRVRTILQLMVALALVLSLMPFPAVAQESMSEKADLVDTAVAAGDFTTLVELVQSAGLAETLKGDGPFTVFAPTDEAFAAVPADVLAALAADSDLLQRVLLYHVVPGRLVAALISDGKEVATAEGSNVLFSFVDGVKAVNGANIVARDIQASNGVIHVIDSVILPADIAAALPAAAEEVAVEEAAAAEATPAPTEEAAEEAAAEATPAPTEEAAEEAAAAEATPAPTEEAAEEAAAAELADIVDTALAAGQFNLLAGALTEAGLVDALRGPGPFTVFAPTDDAFAALPPETFEAVMADPQGLLTQILLYHVVSEKVMAADLVDGQEVPMLQGSTAIISLSDAGAMINNANIIATDIEASNGVIHVIDSVIVPAFEEAVAEEAAAEAVATEAPAEEAAAEAIATEAPAEEAAAEAVATEAPAEEAAAPDMLPVTGGESNSVAALAAALVLAVIAAFVLVTRRRMA